MNIESIYLENFMSYKKERFDFLNTDGPILITGLNSEVASTKESNGSGKTTGFFDSVIWCLFGRIRGNFNKEISVDDVIHITEAGEREKYCKVEIVFSVDGVKYKVLRKRSLDGKTDLQFHVLNGEDWKSLTRQAGVGKRTGRRESSIVRTESAIENVLNCNCELLINSVFLEQDNTDAFAIATKSQRENLFKTALFLHRWDDYSDLAKEELKEIKQSLVGIESVLGEYGSTIDGLEEKKKGKELEIKENKKRKKDLTKKIKKIQDEIQKLSGELVVLNQEKGREKDVGESIEKTRDSISLVRRENKKYKDVIDSVNSEIKNILSNIKKYSEKIEEMKEELGKISKEMEEIPNITDADLKEEEEKCRKLQVKYASLQEEIKKKKEERNNIQFVACPMGIDCEYIGEDYKNKVKKRIAKKLVNLSSALKKKKVEIENALGVVGQLTSYRKDINHLENITKGFIFDISMKEEYNKNSKKLLKDKKLFLASHMSQKKKVEGELKEKEESLKSLLGQQAKLSSLEEKIEGISFKIGIKKKSKGELEFEMDELKNIIMRLEYEIEDSEEKINRVGELTEKFNTLNDRKEIVEFSITLLGKDIPHVLIESAIPEIENYSNESMQKLSDGSMSLSFIMDRETKQKDGDGNAIKTDTMDISVTSGNKIQKYGLLSGGEKKRADLAIHLGYSQYLMNRNNSRLETMWGDEVCSGIDQSGIEAFLSILEEFKHEYGIKKIFIISQNDYLKKFIERQVVVKKGDGGTKIHRWAV